MQFKWTRKKKPLDEELIINKDTTSSKKTNPGKHKCFIFHDKGHFAKGCPMSKKTKREAQSSEKTMACHKDLDDSHLAEENIPRSAFNAEKEKSEDIFIYGQP